MSNWYRALLSNEEAGFIFSVLLFFLIILMVVSFGLLVYMAFSHALLIGNPAMACVVGAKP